MSPFLRRGRRQQPKGGPPCRLWHSPLSSPPLRTPPPLPPSPLPPPSCQPKQPLPPPPPFQAPRQLSRYCCSWQQRQSIHLSPLPLPSQARRGVKRQADSTTPSTGQPSPSSAIPPQPLVPARRESTRTIKRPKLDLPGETNYPQVNVSGRGPCSGTCALCCIQPCNTLDSSMRVSFPLRARSSPSLCSSSSVCRC